MLFPTLLFCWKFRTRSVWWSDGFLCILTVAFDRLGKGEWLPRRVIVSTGTWNRSKARLKIGRTRYMTKPTRFKISINQCMIHWSYYKIQKVFSFLWEIVILNLTFYVHYFFVQFPLANDHLIKIYFFVILGSVIIVRHIPFKISWA